MEIRDLDKSFWSRGEWDLEPDRVDFEYAGLQCFMLRNHSGVWCGYVGVPGTHRTFGKDYDNRDDYSLDQIDVHGGLTFSGPHSYAQDKDKELWWFGFDCNHHMDLAPLNYRSYKNAGFSDLEMPEGTYRNLDYVRDEVKRLAEQLQQIQSVSSGND